MTHMDLFVTRAGPFTLAFSVDQIAWVAPCPSGPEWPPRADGILGWMPTLDGATSICVVDPWTYWHKKVGRGQGAVGSGKPVTAPCPLPPAYSRGRPTSVLVVAGEGVALAIESYVFEAYPVQPAPAVLHSRGVYVLSHIGGGYAVVLDLAHLMPGHQPSAISHQLSTGLDDGESSGDAAKVRAHKPCARSPRLRDGAHAESR